MLSSIFLNASMPLWYTEFICFFFSFYFCPFAAYCYRMKIIESPWLQASTYVSVQPDEECYFYVVHYF